MPKNRLVRALDLKKTASPAPANLSGTAAPVTGGGTTAHALNGPLHTGSLTQVQAPWAATVAALTAHTADANAHHARLHSILSAADHSVSATAGQVLTAATGTTLGWATPLYDVSAGTTALLRSQDGDLILHYLTAANVTATAQVRTPTVDTASGNLTLAPAAALRLNPGTYTELIDAKPLRTASFTSGFAGAGLRIDLGTAQAGKTTVEADNLWVRGRMHVYEMLIHQIRATNGSIFVSSTGKVTAITDNGGGSYSFTCEAGHGFAGGDIIRAQRWNAASSSLYRTDMHVSYSPTPTLTTFTASLQGGTDVPALGHEFVRLGNLSDSARRGGIYMTADDSGAPFLDVFDGVDALADWNTAGVTKVRLGNLNGITGASEYGFWAGQVGGGNVKISGSAVQLRQGSDAVISLNSDGTSRFDGPMTLGTGGGIYQGTGSFASPTTGLKLWRDSGVGRIGGYNGGTLQWYGATDGKLYFGGGHGVLDAMGIWIDTDPVWAYGSTTNGIRWRDGSTLKASVYGEYASGSTSYAQATLQAEDYATTLPYVRVRGSTSSLANLGTILLDAGAGAALTVERNHTTGVGEVRMNAASVELSNSVPVLNVGSGNVSTGAAAVQIGHARTGSGYAQLDFVGDTTYDDYGLRLLRGNGGTNATSLLTHRGTGSLSIRTEEAANLLLQTAGTTRLTVESTGDVDVANTLRAAVLRADLTSGGSGVASTVTITAESYLAVSGGAGAVKMANNNSANNAGWLKLYVGTTVYWVPLWATITP